MRNKLLYQCITAMALTMGVQHGSLAQVKVENTGFTDLVAEPQQLADVEQKNIRVDVSRAAAIQVGQTKGDVRHSLGEPIAKTKINDNEGWEYQLSLPLQDKRSIIVCQFMVVYGNDTGNVIDAYWRRPQCAASADEAVKNVTFGFDQHELNQADIQRLTSVVADARQQRQPYKIVVVGHTDRLGDPTYNQGLSERRAQTVAQYLINQGIPSQRIQLSGRGASDPVVACTGVSPLSALKDCLAPNRRVDIDLLPI